MRLLTWRPLGRPGSLGLGEYPFLRVLPLAVSLLQRLPLANAPKEAKVLAPAFGASLWLGVPSLRDSSGGIASGLLRCTSSRCVWLRQTALRAHPRINPSTQPSEGAGTSKALLELTLIVLSGGRPKPKQEWGCMCFKPEFTSVFHVGVVRLNTSVSPLSLWERARVRAALMTHRRAKANHSPSQS